MVPGASDSGTSVRGSSPRNFPLPTTARAAIVAAALFVTYATMVLSGWPSRAGVDLLTDWMFPVLGLIGLTLAVVAATRAQGRLRAAWAALAAGITAWEIGEVIWTYDETILGQSHVPFPSWANVAYLVWVPCAIAALLLFPSTRSWLDQSRLMIDGLIVTGSLMLISWLTVLRDIWHATGVSRVEFVLTLAYPTTDVLLVALGALVLFRAPPGLRVTLSLLVAGLADAAVGDCVWAYLGDPTGYKIGGVADIFFFANILLVILALVEALHSQPDAAVLRASPAAVALWLPLLPVAVAAVFVATAEKDVVLEAPVIVTGAVLLVATLFRQFIESAEMARRENEIRRLADRLTDELDSASHYVASILPGPLDGPVAVRSRYLPARAVGGDSFGYQWIDDDHLIVYLVDVSGHGVKPALLSVSVHNLLRSGAIPKETLLQPDLVLAELNTRFSMDNHDDHYFTMWYGVYQLSSGLLRYANAGHPPPLVLTDSGDVVGSLPLIGDSMPLAMFGDTEYRAESYLVPPGARILLYSDGVLGDPPQMAQFVALCEQLAAGRSFSLDELAEEAPVSDDDCSLVLLSFPDSAGLVSVEAEAASAVSAGLLR